MRISNICHHPTLCTDNLIPRQKYTNMQSQNTIERPYRSHLQPACLQCKRRKSRCKIEAHSPACLMCRVHGTSCTFPQQKTSRGGRSDVNVATVRPIVASRSRAASQRRQTDEPPPAPPPPPPPPAPIVSPWSSDSIGPATSLAGDDQDQENPHIVGPANTNDSQVLTDYLSIVGSSNARMRMIHPVLSNRSTTRPVLFAAVKKRPVGVEVYSNHAREKLHIIEQLLSPHTQDAIGL